MKSTLFRMCEEDILFWINTFCFIHEPRNLASSDLLFITWPFQDKFFMDLGDAIGRHDLFVEKSRDMGASWAILTEILWQFLFGHGGNFLLVSRNESYVDSPGNPKSLFWKLDFIIQRLPWWMKLGLKRTAMRWENPRNGSVISGESTTSEVARGDRRTAILLDEFSAFDPAQGRKAWESCGPATRCRIINGTPNGTGNVHYELSQKADIRKVRLHWTAHPEKAKGLYTFSEGKLVFLDTSYPFPANYEFVRDGKKRSPWYDNECRRSISPEEIAKELDIDYQGANYQFFPNDILTNHISEYACDPLAEGSLQYDPDTAEPEGFVRLDRDFTMSLWIDLGKSSGRPPAEGQYVVGVDISEGTGASNSCLAVYDALTKEKVCEVSTCRENPSKFATHALAVAKWFNDAFLIWEANGGPGRHFGDRLIEMGYTNIYYRPKSEKAIASSMSDVPGWYSGKEAKNALLAAYRFALSGKEIKNCSAAAVDECRQYLWINSTGKVSHVASENKQSPTGANDGHGDMVIADALANKAFKERVVKPQEKPREIPVGSMAWRIERLAEEARLRDDWGA